MHSSKRDPEYILLVDPYRARRQRLKHTLAYTGYEVETARSAQAALRRALANPPTLIVADISIDEPVGLRRLRGRYEIPLVLILSGRTAEEELAGFNMGADDVITRPENEELVLAHVQAVLRRTRHRESTGEGGADDPIALGDMIVDPASHTVSVGGQPVELSSREFLLLYTLAREAGAVVTREDLLRRVWGPDFIGETQTVYVYINWLRNKLKRNAPRSLRIETVHGVGYKLVAPESE